MKPINDKPIVLIALLCLLMPAFAMASSDLQQLEDALNNRHEYVAAKEQRIDSIKRKINSRTSADERMACYDALYREYLTFRFDSAISYIDRAEALLDAEASYNDRSLIKIHRALSLATSGHFSQAIDLLKSIKPSMLDKRVRSELFSAFEWTYGAWAEYSDMTGFAKEYNDLSVAYLDSLLTLTDRNTPAYHYHSADRALRTQNFETARDGYRKALASIPPASRMYAQSAYGLAMAYRGLGDMDSYRDWLIKAAVSDQITPLKENLALQELALDIRNRDGDLERANRYLNYSLEDAIFYNNRLRMLEISKKFPDIALGYQATITAQNKRLKKYVLSIGILLIILTVAAFIIVREKKKLAVSKQGLHDLNKLLTDLNQKLMQTNVSREQYVSLFMDLCAAYIEKLNRFQSMVLLKVKARQTDDLLRLAGNNTRTSEAEMRELFFNFDTAFLRIYPDFIEKFNSLLQPDKAIVPKPNELLNTDLRIFALIRMGIKDSSKIATLLFYSPQTIFNHRTQVRNRAKNRNTFEQELMNICAVMPDETIA